MTKEMIQNRLQIIADLQQELNRLKTHYDESLEGDADYQEVQEQESETRKEIKEKKEKVVSKPSYVAIDEKVKDVRREIKEQQEVLSQDLVDYYRENGTTEIEDAEGNVKRMKFSVKLVNG